MEEHDVEDSGGKIKGTEEGGIYGCGMRYIGGFEGFKGAVDGDETSAERRGLEMEIVDCGSRHTEKGFGEGGGGGGGKRK
jgi:hypothetical protein